MPGPADEFIVPTKYAAYQAVPGVLTPITAEEVMMPTGFFANDHASVASVLRVTDTAGLPIVPDVEVPPKGTYHLESNLDIFQGLKWMATGGTLYGGMTGYPTV